VVFAGAGVSFPPPSNIPLFNGLASQISGGLTVRKGWEDRFLGKLVRDGTDVHAAATRLVFHKHTSPTQLHFEILRIFNASEKVRIVTTNFDDHFSAAARKVFGRTTPIEYYAPALPLGDQFSGLVYLHGSARVNPRSLVLTDKDFGAAYLTRGWARDFLVPLFSKYSVLFIGYSHSDVTTSYLARGLNQAEIKPRWTMVSSEIKPEGRENWEHLEIGITEYPVDQANIENPHQPLTDFFCQWALHTKESLFARAKRVKTIARGLPPESAEVSEYLNYCLRHPRLALDFCAAIRQPGWVGWLHKHRHFDLFFADTAKTPGPEHSQHQVLAGWLCTFVRRQYPELLLGLVETHQRLTPEFCSILAHALYGTQKKSPDRRFAVWVSIVLANDRGAISDNVWAYLLNECQLPRHAGIALQIFDLLTTPKVRVEKGLDMTAFLVKENEVSKPASKNCDFSTAWPSEAKYWIDKAWAEQLKPHLPEIAGALAATVTKQLTAAHFLLRGVGKANEHYDRLSTGRSSIAEHEQDDSPLDEVFSGLVDILRDILQHWILHNPLCARAHVGLWWSTRVPILKRLAAYAYASDPQYIADERIGWVLQHNLVFRSGMKKEVFDILATGFCDASAAMQRRLLRRIGRGYTGPGANKLDAETLAYEKFNVLVWLSKADPESELLNAALVAIRSTHSKFTERDHPNLDHWHSNFDGVDSKAGVDFDRILNEPPAQYLIALRSIGASSHPHDRWDYFGNLTVLFARDKIWARGFTAALAAEPTCDGQIWGGVFSAWRETVKTTDDWNEILGIIEKLPQDAVVYSEVANFIQNLLWKAEPAVNERIIGRAAALMATAWALCSVTNEKPDGNYRDWLTSAINHVGGWISEFWIQHTIHRRKILGAKWRGIPKSTKLRIIEALHGANQVKVYARIALTPWMGYIFFWDRAFATKYFLPLLDWERDSVVAQQSWSVLLNYNRGTSLEMETELIPYYRQFASRVMGMLKGTTEKAAQFDSHALQNLGFSLAGLAMQIIPDPVESGFFREYLPLLPDSVRADLARGMGRHLEKIDDAARQKLWTDWLRQYLDLRLMGVPVALSDGETKHMLNWCEHLVPVFPEAVDRVVKMRLKNVFAYSVITYLLKSPALEKFPLHVCRLANAGLGAEDYPYLHGEAIALHSRLKAAIPDTPELNAFEELLYLRGWNKK